MCLQKMFHPRIPIKATRIEENEISRILIENTWMLEEYWSYARDLEYDYLKAKLILSKLSKSSPKYKAISEFVNALSYRECINGQVDRLGDALVSVIKAEDDAIEFKEKKRRELNAILYDLDDQDDELNAVIQILLYPKE